MITYVTTFKPGDDYSACKNSIENQTCRTFDWVLWEDRDYCRPVALNKALAHVKTPFWALVDADDWIYKETTSRVLQSIRQSNRGPSWGYYTKCENDPHQRANLKFTWDNLYLWLIPFHLRVERTDWWREGILFNESYTHQSDYERVLRLTEQGIKWEPLGYYSYRYNSCKKLNRLSTQEQSKVFYRRAVMESMKRRGCLFKGK
jgi:hypothetical protein